MNDHIIDFFFAFAFCPMELIDKALMYMYFDIDHTLLISRERKKRDRRRSL